MTPETKITVPCFPATKTLPDSRNPLVVEFKPSRSQTDDICNIALVYLSPPTINAHHIDNNNRSYHHPCSNLASNLAFFLINSKQGPISDVVCDFIPGTTTTTQPSLFPLHPDINMATIRPCNHTFHAVSLIYHFLRNTMSCPICRNGSTKFPLSTTRSWGDNKLVRKLHRRVHVLKQRENAMEIENETRELISTYNNPMTIITDIRSLISSFSPHNY